MGGLGGVHTRPGWGGESAAPLAGPPAIGGVSLWLDADAIGNGPGATASPARGGKLAVWPDLSGNVSAGFVQNTAANQPTYTERGANQHAKVTFDGAASYMTATVAQTAPCSIFLVASLPVAPAAQSTIFNSTGASIIPIIYVTNATPGVVTVGNGATLAAGSMYTRLIPFGESGVAGAQMPFIVGMDITGSGGTGNDYFNSTTPTHPGGTISGNTGFSGVMTIGAQNAGGSNFCACDLYELIIFNAQLTLAQRTLLFNYFTQKYNLGPVVTGAFA